jgi:hypothetical protein
MTGMAVGMGLGVCAKPSCALPSRSAKIAEKKRIDLELGIIFLLVVGTVMTELFAHGWRRQTPTLVFNSKTEPTADASLGENSKLLFS